ncbi:hypothetical protein B0H17DRAFT_343089 [Mycena rosella]|uniref:Uncharacterized protein n=1 Tax=Mycena rosella TaxID=1033263 RepID=A0AAD7CQX7_MYCRO|nr:hypothetical protein B0H17DRAFT_343089 [Mycena rosella]
MLLVCDEAWAVPQFFEKAQLSDHHSILAQASPPLRRILHACILVGRGDRSLFRTHCMLDISWDELRATICPLRKIAGDDPARIKCLQRHILDQTFVETLDVNSLISELANGGMRLTRAMCNGHWRFDPAVQDWGYFLRCCPISRDLVQALWDTSLAAMINNGYLGDQDDLYNVLQWLKTSPPSATLVELMTRVEHKLEAVTRPWATVDCFERRWTEWRHERRRYLE